MRYRSLTMIAMTAFAGAAWAGPQCTTADKSQWQDPVKFQAQLVGLRVGSG